MNKKQALKAAQEYIEELEETIKTQAENYESIIDQLGDFNRRCSADIRGYVQNTQAMIAGKSPCEFCEEHRLGECEHKDCEMGKGCDGWWLRTDMLEVSPPAEGGEANEGQGLLSASPTCGE